MKTTIALVLLAATAHGESYCASRTGRLRVRAVCRAEIGERVVRFGALAPAVVDRDGDLVGYVSGLTRGYELTYPEVLVFRSVGPDTIGLPVNDRGLVPIGSDVLYYTGAACTGVPLVPDYGDSRNGLLKVGPTWPTSVWYATGSAQTATPASYIVPPALDLSCHDLGGVLRGDGFCCVDDEVGGSFFNAAQLRLSDVGLEPPFRLSME